MIEIGLMSAMAAMPLAAEDGSGSVGLLIGIAVVSFAIGAVVFSMIFRRKVAIDSNLAENARKEAEAIKAEAEKDASMIREKADLEAEKTRNRAAEQRIAAKEKFDNEVSERRRELQRAEERLTAKEDNVDKKMEQLETRISDLDRRDKELRNRQEKLNADQAALAAKAQQQLKELERISGMSQDEARDILLARLEECLEQDRGTLIRRFQEENKQKLQADAQEIMVNAMQRYAGDCAYERTTSTIPLPNEDMKGRIIGREGRNIRTIEAATGVNVLIDDTPEAVVISCFDPVRREIARITMERLVADGRIHPARVEEMVNKVKKEVENEIQKAGQETVAQLGITRLRPNIVNLIGRLKYRYSFSQNVLMHSIEVASMMGAIAASVGLDERKAKRAGLLHDIGKAVDHEVEGTHAAIGAELLKRAGEDEDIVNAVAAHHEEVEKTSLMAILVQICDTLSASRPGARSETTELYLKRLEQLEEIGNSFEGVENCYAIQAGRELRVIVQPEKISEDRAAVLAHDMAERIEKEMRYPGQVRVSVIRETRAVDFAK
ncbi:MAG: ribonuclease Y [Victivallales bacterium]|nr:ribonuclease Y [Victivallales bacterium]